MARRILLITYEYPPLGGGTGKAVRNTARTLKAMGYEVGILTSKFKDQARSERVDGIEIFRIPVIRRYLNYANAFEVVSFAGSGILFSSRVLKRFRPDLCLAFLTIPSAIVALHARLLRGAPYLTLLRGQDVPGHPETPAWMHTLAGPLTRLLWRRSHQVIANSEALAEMARTAAPRLPINVVYSGVDSELFHPGPEDAPQAGRGEQAGGGVRVLYLGRLRNGKRLDVLVRAWARLRQTGAGSIELRFIGFGPERAVLERMVDELRLGDSVRFLGRLDEPDVIAALQEADVLVNISQCEGLPNVVLEAMACGVAVLASDIGPHRELISPGREGLLCDGSSEGSVADSLERLITQPELRRAMGEAGRRAATERFGWERVTKDLALLFPGVGADLKSGVPPA